METIDKIIQTLDKELKDEGLEFQYTDGDNGKYQIICNDFEAYRYSKKLKIWKKILTKKYPECKWYMVYINI